MVIVALALMQVLAQPEPEPDPLAELTPRLYQSVPRLKRIMRQSLVRAEPFARTWRIEGQTVFRGSFDWHSCVHAHWSLLTMARLEGDRELQDFLLERLAPAVLAAERESLMGPNLERGLPYARSWLYMLLEELRSHPYQDQPLLEKFSADIRNQLLNWLETSAFPERRARSRRRGPTYKFRGDYHSWIFPLFCLQLQASPGSEVGARLDALIKSRLNPQLEALLAGPAQNPRDFLHLPGLVGALLAARNPPGLIATPDLGPDPQWPDTVDLRNTHVLGYELTRTLPTAMAAAGDAEAMAALDRRLGQVLDRRHFWDGHFIVVDHWVPQFLWINMWLALGAP